LFQIQVDPFGKVVIEFNGIDKLKLVGTRVPSRYKEFIIVVLYLPHGDIAGFQILEMIEKAFHHKEITLSRLLGIPLLLQLLSVKLQFRSVRPVIMFEPG